MVKVATPAGAPVEGSTAADNAALLATPEGKPLTVMVPVGAAIGTGFMEVEVEAELIALFSTSTLITVGWFWPLIYPVCEVWLEAPIPIAGVSFTTVNGMAEADDLL